MQTSLLSVSLATLVVVAIAGLWVLLTRLFQRLERLHPATFDSLGRPSFSSAVNTGPAVLAFLLLRRHRVLGDRSLSRLADLTLIYVVGYLVLVVFVIRLSAPHPAA